MNKDVIYVEPEDDITDIILKIEKSKEKIVALVPPKKAGVFRSVVNIKLIAKAGKTSDKTIVLVTVDPSIVKLAAATKLPVAKNLQSAPSIPTLEHDEDDSVSKEDLEEKSDDEPEADAEDEATEVEEEAEEEEEEEEDIEDDEDDTPKKEKPSKKQKSAKKSGGLIGWFKDHKKLSILIGICGLGLVVFLVWAFVFAPAVDVQVSIKTEQKNFSEGITFTDNLSEENAEEGKFYLEQKKIESVQEVTFDATGQKNEGEKATGEVVVVATVPSAGGAKVINAGDIFTVEGLSYVADSTVTMSYDGRDDSVCSNADTATKREFDRQGCRIYANIKVTAAKPGAQYNISARASGWDTTANVAVSSEKPMTGGTDDIKTVVQQSDVLKASSELTSANEEENKLKLYGTIDDKYYVLEASFEQTTADAVASPAVDQEVGEGVEPTLKATTTAMVYVIDKVKLEEFIKAKAELEDDQKVYEIKDIYIEKISEIASGATGKLKAQYYVGPKLTEAEVVEKIKGRGLGDAQREIRDIYGVSDVKMNPSYPWVMAVPGDSNRVTVRFEIKDQSGNEIKAQDDKDNQDDENKEESEGEEESKKEE